MTPGRQRIAIEKACRYLPYHKNYRNYEGEWELPDYFSDLNAMHEAILSLSKKQRDKYITQCAIVIGDPDSFAFNNMTAAQRAEAFLRTIGKWSPVHEDEDNSTTFATASK